jgi:hypothetical protein
MHVAPKPAASTVAARTTVGQRDDVLQLRRRWGSERGPARAMSIASWEGAVHAVLCGPIEAVQFFCGCQRHAWSLALLGEYQDFRFAPLLVLGVAAAARSKSEV